MRLLRRTGKQSRTALPSPRRGGNSTSGSIHGLGCTGVVGGALVAPPLQQRLQAVTVRQHVQCDGGDDGVCVTVMTVNCGNGGIVAVSDLIRACADAEGVDVVLLNETHLVGGESVVIPGFGLYYGVRPAAAAAGRRCGGVAVAVRDGLCAREPVVVMECDLGDAMCVRLPVCATAVPLFVVSVYVPPDSNNFCCDCVLPSCHKCNVDASLAFVAECVRVCGLVGPVLVGGDLNAHCEQGVRSRRWGKVQRIVLGDEVAVTNPVAVVPMDGSADTRLSGLSWIPTREHAVLDLVIFTAGTLVPGAGDSVRSSCSTVLIDNIPIGDHLPLLSAVTLPPLVSAPGAARLCGEPVPPTLSAKAVGLPTQKRKGKKAQTQLLGVTLSKRVLALLPDNSDPLSTGTPAQLIHEFQRVVSDSCAHVEMWGGQGGRAHTSWGVIGGPEHEAETAALQSLMDQRVQAMRNDVDAARASGGSVPLIKEIHRKNLRRLGHSSRALRRAGQEAQLAAAVEMGDCKEVSRLLKITATGLRHSGKHVSGQQDAAQDVALREEFLFGRYSTGASTPQLKASVSAIRQLYSSDPGCDSTDGSTADAPVCVSGDDVRCALSRMRSGANALELTVPALKTVCGDAMVCDWLAGVFQRILRSGVVPEAGLRSKKIWRNKRSNIN